MKKTCFIIFILSFLAITSALAADIQYPVKELGNCQDEADCKLYCDKSENVESCLSFAKKNNLMSEQEINIAEKFIAAQDSAPGGCQTKDACETYCNDISHIDECISFAEKNNLLTTQELAEAKMVQSAIAKGVKPPPCGNKKNCDAYCEDPSHMEECITFGATAGFIQGKELEDAQKMLQAVKKGVKPPPCKGKDACDAYCSQPDNMEVCMTFAIEAGLMPEQEKADAQKMLQALKQGVKPPPCKGKDACDIYCAQDEHFDECMNFAMAAGMMSEENAVMAKKTRGKGPGDCKGKEACEAFCNNPDNQETCFNFAKDNGLIPAEDLRKMEEGKTQMKNALETSPPEVIDCLTSLFGTDLVEKLKAGTAMPSKEMGDKMGECFSKSPNGGVPFGPGGCKGQEECKAYCESHPDECQNIQQGPQDNNVKQTGPGGCTSPEECEAYCSTHRQECGAPPGESEPGQPGEQQPQVNPNQPGAQNPPCQGENCQNGPLPLQPGQQIMPGQELLPGRQPPPEGNLGPAQPQPTNQPPQGSVSPVIQQQPQNFVPPESSPPPPETPPPPSTSLEKFLGSIIDGFNELIPHSK